MTTIPAAHAQSALIRAWQTQDPSGPELARENLAEFHQAAQEIASIANAAGTRIDSTNILKVGKAPSFGEPTADDMRKHAAHGLG